LIAAVPETFALKDVAVPACRSFGEFGVSESFLAQPAKSTAATHKGISFLFIKVVNKG